MPADLVFDSWPILAFLQGEPAEERIIEIIADAQENGSRLLMSCINAGEVLYTVTARYGDAAAKKALDALDSLGIKIIDADWPQTQIAAQFKSRGGISYADCFAAALAKQSSATLITGDREFERLKKDINIEWL